MDNIQERLKAVIDKKIRVNRRFKELEELSTISIETWKTWWNRGSKPSMEIIEAICHAWPEYAYWIATGLTDEAYGHVSPVPEYTYPEYGKAPKQACSAFFRATLAAKKAAVDFVRDTEGYSHQPGQMPTIIHVPRSGFEDEDSPLSQAMAALQSEKKKRQVEIGVGPDLDSVIKLIKTIYEDKKLLELVSNYNKQAKADFV